VLLNALGSFINVIPFLLMAMFWFFWKLRRKTLAPIWGFLFFSITILPPLAVSDTGTGVFLSDRYTYVPSIGIFFAIVYFLFKVKKQYLKNVAFVIVGISLIWGVTAFEQVKVWKDTATLNSATLEVNPTSHVALTNRGRFYRQRKKYDLAMQDYTDAIKYNPRYHLAYNNRGKLNFDLGNKKQAIKDLNNAIKYNRKFAASYSNRGAVYGSLGKYDKALVDLKKAVKINKYDINAHSNMGVLYRMQKEYKKCIKSWKKCVRLRPSEPSYYGEISFCYIRLKEYKKAVQAATNAIKVRPNYSNAYANRATANFYLKNYKKAYVDAQKAQRLGFNVNPQFLKNIEKAMGG